MATRQPTLTLAYLPHLDYNLQRLGPDLASPRLQKDLAEIDALCGELIEAAEREGRRVIVVSEYGITPATDAIHVNRALRAAGLLAVRREEQGRETLDAGASAAFAVADHQIAHVYVRDPARVAAVRGAGRAGSTGWSSVWDAEGKRANGLDHPRSGELVAMARADRWFSYYYWLDEARAPDFARTVDIHRKPGYDPVELFIDPAIRMPSSPPAGSSASASSASAQLLDVISPTDTRLVKGTHGRLTDDPADGPLVISSEPDLLPQGPRRGDRLQAAGARSRLPEDRVRLAKARAGRPWTD